MRYRNKKYLQWVKEQPCCLCGTPEGDAHHIKGIGHMSGAGLTAPDWAVMPACRVCHGKIHNEPDLWPHQWEWIARTLGRAIEEGVLCEPPK